MPVLSTLVNADLPNALDTFMEVSQDGSHLKERDIPGDGNQSRKKALFLLLI